MGLDRRTTPNLARRARFFLQNVIRRFNLTNAQPFSLTTGNGLDEEKPAL
jgi:hypothetical protein